MFLGMLQNIGVPAAPTMAWVVGILEFFGGLALAILGGGALSVDGIIKAKRARQEGEAGQKPDEAEA